VITLALTRGTNISSTFQNAWRPMPSDATWTIVRAVIASGSTPSWSPITPGFSVSPEPAVFNVRKPSRPENGWRMIALARLDHDGGSRRYFIELGLHMGFTLRMKEFPGNLDWDDWQLPELFGTLG
jgi:hypothetical protein